MGASRAPSEFAFTLDDLKPIWQRAAATTFIPPSSDSIMPEARDRRTVFFVHIEKTGGTSLRAAALDYFPPDQVVTFYGRDSRNTSQIVKDIFFSDGGGSHEKKLARLSRHMAEQDVRFFSSHIPDFWALDGFDPRCAVTLLRSPAERIVSHYLFHERKRRQRLRFRDYIEDPKHQNAQARKLGGIPLAAFRLVGITEDFDGFVRAFNHQFGVDFSVRHEKKARLPYRLMAYLLLRRYRKAIEALNPLDVERYAEARRLWAATKARMSARQ